MNEERDVCEAGDPNVNDGDPSAPTHGATPGLSTGDPNMNEGDPSAPTDGATPDDLTETGESNAPNVNTGVGALGAAEPNVSTGDGSDAAPPGASSE